MKLEIFVVKTPKEDKIRLQKAKQALIKLYGGCTVIPNCKGFWNDETDAEIDDSVEIWLIYSLFPKKNSVKARKRILHDIRIATCQRVQFWTVNSKPYCKQV